MASGAGTATGEDVSGTVIVILLAASGLAIAVDRLITIEEDEDDLPAFEAGFAAIAEAMARQTRLYTPPRDDRPGR